MACLTGSRICLWRHCTNTLEQESGQKHPYAGYRQEVSWIDAVAAKKGFELAKEI